MVMNNVFLPLPTARRVVHRVQHIRRWRRWHARWILGWGSSLGLLLVNSAVALPPPEDVPEEILRTEIITEGRSPLTGEPLTASEYAQLQATLAEVDVTVVPEEWRSLIFLLQLRRVIQPVLPILP
jgi:hypothetical protein